MRFIKPLKILSFIATVIVCTYYSFVFQVWAEKQIHDYKRKLVAQVIAEDLAGKDLTIDIKDKKTKTLETLTITELRKAFWILNVQNEQLRYSLDTVRSALEYHQEEK